MSANSQKISAEVEGVGQAFCGRRYDWSNLLQSHVRLVKTSVEVGGIGQTFCSHTVGEIGEIFLQEQLDLVKILTVVVRIGLWMGRGNW